MPDILTDGYTFSTSGSYFSPPEGSLQTLLNTFQNLPFTDLPEAFGMHSNANVTFSTNESVVLMSALLSLQPRSSGAGGDGVTIDETVSKQ